jgi:hypothetical protein
MPLHRSIAVLLLVWAFAAAALPVAALARDADKTAALVSEIKRAFTINDNAIPPEIFRDFGDGNLADSDPIWITVDVQAATGSNLYYDPIRKQGDWTIQTKQRQATDTPEETAYAFYGATKNGLLVVVASYNAGGTGTFHTLHILDLMTTRAFDADGKRAQRISLSHIRSVALGDRWEGEIKLNENTVHIITTRKGPVDAGPQPPSTITAERP